MLSSDKAKINPYVFSLSTLVVVVLFQSFFGEYFYKQHLFGIYASEFSIILCWLVTLFGICLLKKIYLPKKFGPLFFLCIIYGVYSVYLGYKPYWILRQFTIFLYLSVFVFSCYYAEKTESYEFLFRVFNASYYYGLVFVVVGNSIAPGNPDYTSTLIFLLGLAHKIKNAKTIFVKNSYFIFAVIVMMIFSKHTAFVLAVFGVYAYLIWPEWKAGRVVIFILSIIAFVVGVCFTDGLYDYNAVWRFKYWYAVLERSWSSHYLLFGQGFGESLMPTDSVWYPDLINQVRGINNSIEYQIHTVPPHNGILTLLIYMGLPGVIAFLVPIIVLLGTSMKKAKGPLHNTVGASVFGMVLLLCSNQFLEVPYSAIIFWLLVGLLCGLDSNKGIDGLGIDENFISA